MSTRERISEILEARGTSFDPLADLISAFEIVGCMIAELMQQSVLSLRAAAAFAALGCGMHATGLLVTRTGPGWGQAMLAGVAFLLAVYALMPRTQPEHHGVESWLFMPYCVCPHCDVEALHWIRPTRWAASDGTTGEVFRECRECGRDWAQRVLTEASS